MRPVLIDGAPSLAPACRSYFRLLGGTNGAPYGPVTMQCRSYRTALAIWTATPKRLELLIAVLLEAGGLTVGREAAEARPAWTAALREASRMHTPFDEEWFASLLAARGTATDTGCSGAEARTRQGPPRLIT